MNEVILQAEHLCKWFFVPGGGKRRFPAVDDVSFQISRGEIEGLLGASGCGKSTLARLLLGLTQPDSGVIRYGGREIQSLSPRQFHPLRQRLQMVFQNPYDSLDPSRRVGVLLEEPLRIWRPRMDRRQRLAEIGALLEQCGLDPQCVRKTPLECSGGQLQRLSIARALLVRPEFLVADEIVSALDVSVQNQLLELLVRLRDEYGLTILFISHDLAVVRKLSDRILVMREGRLLRQGCGAELWQEWTDPYLCALKEAMFPFPGGVEPSTKESSAKGRGSHGIYRLT